MRAGLINNHSKANYAAKLAELIVEMANQETNVLLQLFSDDETIYTNKKYPETPLVLADSQLQVYYHTHQNNILHENEHGHFHIFYLSKDMAQAEAVHLVALSMDNFGQALSWFTVNKWVTSQACFDSDIFLTCIKRLSINAADSLLLRWLSTMILFYQHEVAELLDSSVDKLAKLVKTSPNDEISILDDKSIYFLNEKAIDLSRDLLHSDDNILFGSRT